MHHIIYGIREIPPEQLPTIHELDSGKDRAASDWELLNFGFHRLNGDLFSVAEQYHGDVAELEGRLVRVWRHHDEAPAPDAALAPRTVEEAAALRPHGELLSYGPKRYEQLPPATCARVLHAEIVRAAGPEASALAIVEGNLLEQMAAVEEFVGDVPAPGGGAMPLVDFDRPSAVVEEAGRLAELPESRLVRLRVRMQDVVDGADVVDTENLIPHTWAGER